MKSFLTICLTVLALAVFAQEPETSPNTQPQDSVPTVNATPPPAPKSGSMKDKIYFGGYVNASFGRYTLVGVEPMIAYKLTPKFSTGVKIRYDYIRDSRYSETYETSNYGGSLFARYRVIPSLYGHAEYAVYNYDYYTTSGVSTGREWIPFFYVGAGYSKRISKNTWLNAQVLFDVLQDDRSPFNRYEPFYSVGVGVGF